MDEGWSVYVQADRLFPVKKVLQKPAPGVTLKRLAEEDLIRVKMTEAADR